MAIVWGCVASYMFILLNLVQSKTREADMCTYLNPQAWLLEIQGWIQDILRIKDLLRGGVTLVFYL